MRERKPKVVHVKPAPFATPHDVELPRGTLALERGAADLADALRGAHAIISAALARVPTRDREAVFARVARPIHLLLDVIERFAPASAEKGWRPRVIDGGRDA